MATGFRKTRKAGIERPMMDNLGSLQGQLWGLQGCQWKLQCPLAAAETSWAPQAPQLQLSSECPSVMESTSAGKPIVFRHSAPVIPRGTWTWAGISLRWELKTQPHLITHSENKLRTWVFLPHMCPVSSIYKVCPKVCYIFFSKGRLCNQPNFSLAA